MRPALPIPSPQMVGASPSEQVRDSAVGDGSSHSRGVGCDPGGLGRGEATG